MEEMEPKTVEIVLGQIRGFARDHKLTAKQLGVMFEMGNSAYQATFGLPDSDDEAYLKTKLPQP